MAGIAIGTGGTISVQRSLLTISSSANDANPGIYTIILVVTQAASLNVTGFSGGATNRVLIVIAGTAAGVTLKHQSASSSAANRMVLKGAADVSIPQWHAVVLIYNSDDSRWMQIGTVTILI